MPAVVYSVCGRIVFRGVATSDAILCRSARTRCASTLRQPRTSKTLEADLPVSDEPAPQEGEKKFKKTRPQVWTSRLERNTLGASSSVLVLRDVEQKKIGHKLLREKKEGEDIDKNLNVNQILRSIKGQNHDPEQQEVNRNLNSMRPDNTFPTFGRPPCISQTIFDELFKSLCEGFSQTQLAKYINACSSGEQDSNAMSSPKSSSYNPRGGGHAKQMWHMLNPTKSGSERPSTTSSTTRGKGAFANRIIRSVWGFEIREEISSDGYVRLHVDPRHLDLILVGGDASAIRELSIEKGLKIDVHRSEGIILFTADKYKCLEAVELIGRLLHNVCTVEIDLKSFRTPRRKANASPFYNRLAALAAKCQSSIEERLDTNYLIIRSRTKSDSEYCQRILVVALLGLKNDTRGISLINSSDDDQSGYLCASTDSGTGKTNIRGTETFGRFCASHILPALREKSTTRPIPRTILEDRLSKEICSRISNAYNEDSLESASHDRDTVPKKGLSIEAIGPMSWAGNAEVQLFAEPGHVLHEMKNDFVIENLCTSRLVKRVPPTHMFVPSAAGLPHFLLNCYSDVEAKRRDFLRVPFVPSPWISNAAKHGHLPSLEMILAVDQRTHLITVESLTIVLSNQSVDVMLPELGTDLRVTRTDVLHYIDPAKQPAVERFVRHIQDSAVGYGNIRPPLFFQLPIPSWTIGQPQTQTRIPTATYVELEFMSTGIEYEESLLYDFQGQELSVRQVGGGEFGAKYKSLRLRKPNIPIVDDPDDWAEGQSETQAKSPLLQTDTTHDFIKHVSSLLRELQLAHGNMNMVGTNPKYSDVRKAEQRNAHLNMSYDMKQIPLYS